MSEIHSSEGFLYIISKQLHIKVASNYKLATTTETVLGEVIISPHNAHPQSEGPLHHKQKAWHSAKLLPLFWHLDRPLQHIRHLKRLWDPKETKVCKYQTRCKDIKLRLEVFAHKKLTIKNI